jgi:hypothetical protein
MSAVQERRERERRTHKLCYLQALAARYGQHRVTLCGKVHTGPRRRSSPPPPPCPMCFEVVAEHRATCEACIAHGWTAQS